MESNWWFDNISVIGKLSSKDIAQKLIELGDSESASFFVPDLPGRGAEGHFANKTWSLFDRPWRHTSHTFGYVPPFTKNRKTSIPIVHAGNISSNPKLKNERIKITLDRLRIAAYPGSGIHRVLFDFYAQNQIRGQIEHLHYNATYRIASGEHAAILGFPIFVGLNVGKEGVAFRCFTINVKNETDEAFLVSSQ